MRSRIQRLNYGKLKVVEENQSEPQEQQPLCDESPWRDLLNIYDPVDVNAVRNEQEDEREQLTKLLTLDEVKGSEG